MEKKTWCFLLFTGLMLSGCAYDGEAIFLEKGCIGCHSFKGNGGSLGPDLTAVSARLSQGEIRRYIKNPLGKNPKARMPSYDHLSSAELNALALFLGGSD